MIVFELVRGEQPRRVEVSDDEVFLTQREAAKLLRVGTTYLRDSDCPKVLLPPTRGTRPLVRYRRGAVVAWATHWEVAPTWLEPILYPEVAA